MRRDPLLALLGALLSGCAAILGVEPLSGGDGGSDAGADVGSKMPAEASVSDAGPTEPPACTPVWVDASGGFVPPGAVNAEPIDARTVTIYVCRASSGNDSIPGKLRPDYGCYYGNGDAEVFNRDYQVLVPVDCTAGWGYAPAGVAPANAVVCGHDSEGDLYSCRVTDPSTDEGELGHSGWSTNHTCFYSLSGNSLVSTDFDILTLQ